MINRFQNKSFYLCNICVCTVYIYYVYTVMAKNIGTLGKYDQRRLWKLICIVNPFDLLLKNSQKSNLGTLKWFFLACCFNL